MIVIADSSPLIVLAKIGHIDVLPQLFQRVVIPPAVATELVADYRPAAIRDFFLKMPVWILIQKPGSILSIPKLHRGEIEALSLAIELRADVFLVDERKAYREAVARKVNAIGTIRVLERAAEEGRLDLGEAFARIKQTDFWISHELLDERLKLHKGAGAES